MPENPRPYIDLLIVLPLEEELQEFIEHFKCTKDISTSTSWRHFVDSGTSISILAVQQEKPGKEAAIQCVADLSNEYDIGLVICLGIAGSISSDLNLGDVCYSGDVVDVLDNSKASDSAQDTLDISFSPTHYETPRNFTAAFSFMRTMPANRATYTTWQNARSDEAAKQGLSLIPISRNATIACDLPPINESRSR